MPMQKFNILYVSLSFYSNVYIWFQLYFSFLNRFSLVLVNNNNKDSSFDFHSLMRHSVQY